MAKNTESEMSNLHPLRVLMVEDSEDDALLVLRELKKGGYNPEYERVETAAAMRKALQDKTWDVILCDYQLPSFNGIEAIAVLKEINIDIPIIMVSGAIGEETAAGCMRLGAHDYVMKGNLSRLVPAIERELKEISVRRARKQAEEELHRTNVFLDLIVENIPNMIFLKDAKELRFVRFNRAGEDLLGHSMDDLLGKNDYDFFPKEQANFFTEKDREVLHGKEVVDIPEEPIQTRNKGERILHTKKVPILNENGEPEYLLGISEDITDRKRAEEALRASEENFHRSLDESPQGVRIISKEGETLYANRTILDIFGYDSIEELQTTPTVKRYTEQSYAAFKVRREERRLGKDNSPEYGIDIVRKDGEVRHLQVWRKRILWNGKEHYQVIYRDITDRKRTEKALEESEKRYRDLSIIDDLTQLYNSRYFYDQLKSEIDRVNRYGQPLTLLLLDLDNFKVFNDSYGHIEGDQVLSRLGQVAKRCLRQTDSAYRYGGEEFTILLPMTTSTDGAVTAERIRTEFKKENFPPVAGKDVHMTVSIGLAQYQPQEDMKVFVHRVDQLMYQAKKNGKDRVCSES